VTDVWSQLYAVNAPWFLRVQGEGLWCHYPRSSRGPYKQGKARATSDGEVRAYLLRIGQLIRDAMAERDLSADAIRAACGVSKFTICNILRGRKTPSLETLVRVARAMNLSPSELLP
jgi:DNA-binding XRE family transcriptional regulator